MKQKHWNDYLWIWTITYFCQSQYDDYKTRRGMDDQTARRFLSHLLK